MSRYGHWTEADVQRLCDKKLTPREQEPPTGVRPRKYRNVPTEYAGLFFGSKKEARRAQELILMAQAGLITDLVLDKRWLRYDLIVNGQTIGTYEADSRYCEQGRMVVEDVKSKPTKTREYRRNKKWMKALYGIDIQEVY
jgi:hypothetical protein